MAKKALQKFIDVRETGAKKKERIRQEKKKIRQETKEYFEQKKREARQGFRPEPFEKPNDIKKGPADNRLKNQAEQSNRAIQRPIKGRSKKAAPVKPALA